MLNREKKAKGRAASSDDNEGLTDYIGLFGNQVAQVPNFIDRHAAERKAAATPKQRARKRIRTVHIHFRTTPAIKGMLEELMAKDGISRTDVIDQAIEQAYWGKQGQGK